MITLQLEHLTEGIPMIQLMSSEVSHNFSKLNNLLSVMIMR